MTRSNDGNDAASIRTVLPAYGSVEARRGPRPDSPTPSYRTVRPNSPTPSYRTVDPNAAASTSQNTSRNPFRKLFSRQSSTVATVTSERKPRPPPPPQLASQSSKWARHTPWAQLEGAIKANNAKAVSNLLSNQRDRNLISELQYKTAIQTAVECDFWQGLRVLIKNGNDYGISRAFLLAQIDTIIINDSNDVLLGLLETLGPGHLGYNLRGHVRQVAACGNGTLMLMLKQCKMDYMAINDLDTQGRSPMHLAVMFEPQNIDILLQFGADINVANSQGHTPLHCAAREDRSAAVEILINRGADSARLDICGDTPLLSALKLATTTSGRDVPKSRTLLALTSVATKETANCSEGRSGCSALHLAVRLGYPSVVDQLLHAGADAGARSRSGETPLHFASRVSSARDAIEIAKSLISAGADASVQRKFDNRTALDVAVLHVLDSWKEMFDCERKPWFDLIQVLQQAGARCTVPGKLDKLTARYLSWKPDLQRRGKSEWLES